MKGIILVATILWALNLKFFISLFSLYTTFYEVAYEMLVYYVIVLFLSTLFSFSKHLNFIFLNLLFIISIFGIYFINSMGIVIDGNMLNNILSTDSAEAFELANNFLFIYLFVSFVFLFLINKYLLLKQKRLKLRAYASMQALILIVALGLFELNRASLDRFMATDTPSIAPVFLIPSISEYVILRDRLVEINKKNISSEYELSPENNTSIVVFILGESARGDRFSLNGYERQTTPKLSKMENLISYKNTTSCHTSTLNSIPCLMSRVLQKDYDITIEETSFVQVFRDLGYETYWFTRHSNQKRVNTFCEEAEVCEYLTDTKFDEALVEKLDVLKNSKNNSLIVLHTLGSHFDYNEREPEVFQHYKPLCKGNVSGCSKEELDNSYDNTILYTDTFIAKVIQKLQNESACVVYTSDHGESLGEGDLVQRYGHSTPYAIAPKEQKDVPLLLWFSDKYLETHKELNISKIGNVSNTSHDNIFDTILGCGGIKPKHEKRENLNLLSR